MPREVLVYIKFDDLGYFRGAVLQNYNCSICQKEIPNGSVIDYAEIRGNELIDVACTQCLITSHKIAACKDCGKLRQPHNLENEQCVMCRLGVKYIDCSV